MKEKYIVIGSKPYENLQLNNLIDSFGKNCRCNMSVPNNNNGTKYYDQYLNSHVYENFIVKKWDFDFIKRKNKYSENKDGHIEKFINSLNENKFRKIYKQQGHSNAPLNNFVKNKGCPFKLKKQPRMGLESIYRNLNKGVEIFVIGFSINKSEPLNSLVHTRKKTSDCHDKYSEIEVMVWMHENNLIDATFCALEDEDIPVIDCSIIKPKKNSLDLIWEEYGEIHLKLGEDRQRIIKDKE